MKHKHRKHKPTYPFSEPLYYEPQPKEPSHVETVQLEPEKQLILIETKIFGNL